MVNIRKVKMKVLLRKMMEKALMVLTYLRKR